MVRSDLHVENIISKVYTASLKFLDPLTPEATYATIVDEAVKLVNGEDGLMLLKDRYGLKNVYGSSEQADRMEVRKKGFAYSSFKERQAFTITKSDFEKIHPDVAKLGIRSTIFIPLSYKSKSIGVLVVRSKDNIDFTNKELEILKLFGSMASLAVRKTQLYAETKTALELRDTFLSLASHELRTPLTVINGYSQMLYKKYKDDTSPEASWIKKLYKENARLTSLVKEILEVNKIKSGQIQYFWSESSIIDIAKDALHQFSLQYPDRTVIFREEVTDNTALIIGDKEKLSQMVLSLLDNAAKFSPIDSPIHFTLSKKNNIFQLKIEDLGQGISKASIDKIFESFYKGEISKEGIGIGLYLVKNVVDEHHGSIKINSKIQKGTKVLVSLPVHKQ